jgi:hypothetical protein
MPVIVSPEKIPHEDYDSGAGVLKGKNQLRPKTCKSLHAMLVLG